MPRSTRTVSTRVDAFSFRPNSGALSEARCGAPTTGLARRSRKHFEKHKGVPNA